MRRLLTIGTRRRRVLVKLLAPAAALAIAAALVQTAAAAPPTRTDFASSSSFTLAAGTLCSFPVEFSATQEGTVTQFFDADGVLSKRISTGTEQDTFSANGRTLVGDRYSFTFVSEYESGVRVTWYGTGVAERVKLPDGTTFIVAGRSDVLAGGGGIILSVDSGNSGNNLEAFCAALS